MNEHLDYLDRGIKLGAGLGAFLALRGVLTGGRMAGKGMYRRAVKLRGKYGK